MEKRELLYEGKAKKIYTTENADLVIVHYKDDATAGNGAKKGTIAGKGPINNRISNHLMQLLHTRGVMTHFVEELSERETLVRRVNIIPLEVIMRNVAAGSLCQRLGLEEGTLLSRPVLEYSYKNDALGDPLVNEYHILAMQWADEETLGMVATYAFRINDVLRDHFEKVGINLIDFKLEFGFTSDGVLVLADEISPDNCRLWDSETGKKLDKDRFRQDMDGIEDAYKEVMQRLLGSGTE